MSTNLLQNMIDQAEANARDRAAHALIDEEIERNREIASAGSRMTDALGAELLSALGIDLAEIVIDGQPTVTGEFDLAGHSMIARATAGPAAIYLLIAIAAHDVIGNVIGLEKLADAELNGRADFRQHNAERVADALRAAVALAPDARIKIAQRTRKAISEQIGPRCYRQTEAGQIDRSHARTIKANIILAAPLICADGVADLRGQLCRHARHARQYQAQERERRTREAERAEALAAVTETAKQYAAIYAQYSEAART